MKYPIAIVGDCWFSSRGLLGTVCGRNLPIYQRANAGCVDFYLRNLPDRDSGHASPPISLYETLAANAVTYALIGLIGETLRLDYAQ